VLKLDRLGRGLRDLIAMLDDHRARGVKSIPFRGNRRRNAHVAKSARPLDALSRACGVKDEVQLRDIKKPTRIMSAMKLIVFLLFFLPLTWQAFGQQGGKGQTLSYSGTVLKLNDAEQPILELLKKGNFEVKALKSEAPEKQYLVTENQSAEIVGVITFRRGSLVKAYRDWTPVAPSAYALVIAVKGAIDALRKDGSGCVLDTSGVQEPNYSNQSRYIVCGFKSVEISAIQSSQLKSGTTVTVYEWLKLFD
jgi:hypothetical protein